MTEVFAPNRAETDLSLGVPLELGGKISAREAIAQGGMTLAQARLFEARAKVRGEIFLRLHRLKLVEESRVSDQLVGFNISLPIPVFNANGAGRAAAAAGVRASEARKQFGIREQELRREEFLKVYEQAVKVLSTSLSHKEIEKRHEEAEKLFLRGVVPSALVIEAHRTSYELERTRHERELKALEALLGLYAIEGTILETGL